MRYFRLPFLLPLFLLAGGIAQSQPADVHQISHDLQVRRLTDNVWLHTWWMESHGWGRFSSNGLIVVSGTEALLIDTPVDDAMTDQLMEWIADSLHVTLRRAILTHAHNDRMGGIAALKQAGVVSYALPLTAERDAVQGWPQPDSLLLDEQSIPVGERSLLVWFPGAGHAPDNIVVWLDQEKILYGGCLVKSEESQTIGNLGDAVIEEWPRSIRRLINRFGDATVVIPGHGATGGTGALQRTLELLEEASGEEPGSSRQ